MLMIHRFDGDRTGSTACLLPPGNDLAKRPPEQKRRAGVSPDLLVLEREIKIARDAYVKASGPPRPSSKRTLPTICFRARI